jgi:hypothetical protein
MHDDDDDTRSDEILEQYGWKDGEREAHMAEMTERQREIERAEMLAWCEQRSIGAPITRNTTAVVSRANFSSLQVPARETHVRPPSANVTAEWQRYIKRAIQKEARTSDELMAKAIAQTIGKDLTALERSNAELAERVKYLDNEVAELIRMQRAQARDAEIAEQFKRYDELQERLARLESGGRPLKVVG